MKNRIISLFIAGVIMMGLSGCGESNDTAKISVTNVKNGTNNVFGSSVNGYLLSENSKDYVALTEENTTDSYGPLKAVDDLNRVLPTAEDTYEAGTGKKREVAMFYVLWHSQETGPYLFSDVLSQNQNPAKPPTSSPWLGGNTTYYWGEPLFGYYHTDDGWVMRKHVEMLTHAGIDFLVVDTTNDSPYCVEALKLMKILDEYQRQGWDVPKICFYTNTDSSTRMMQLYNQIYKLNKYPNTWYMYNGKPMIIGIEKNAPATIKNFFNMRASQWPNSEEVENGFPWIDFRETAKVYKDKDGKNGVISVSVAQNSSDTSCFGDSLFYGDTKNRGRSYHNGAANITEDSYKYGYNFQEQWDNAINSDADIAMVLEWNEWTAGAWNRGGDQPIAIFDCVTPEYSRDIEPMQGGYFDNYYMQLVANVRKFKGTTATVVQDTNKTIDVTGNFNQWNGISVTYRDFTEGTIRRDALGTGGKRYVNNTGRNGVIYSKITQDDKNVYFYAQTQEDISPYQSSEGSWMNLYLNINADKASSWNGYNYCVNYKATDKDKTTVAKYNGEAFETVGTVSYQVLGNQMMIAVPKSLLNLSGSEISFEFKWADSREAYQTVEDFYEKGDCAPYGRFNYEYNGK